MFPLETRSVLLANRAAPIARGRWCWPALLPGVAVALDAAWPIMPAAGALGLLWLDLAALVCLGWATLGERRVRPTDWITPMDGQVVAGLVLALLHVMQLAGEDEPMMWLHQIAAAGACFYALAARLRRDPLAPDAIWPSFAFMVLALGAFTLACATQGTDAVVRATRLVDAHWASDFGLAKTMLLATVLCVGRAAEPDARSLWRVTALVGVVSFVLLAATGGVGLRISSLASLDEPFYFGTSIVAFMFLSGLARMAWHLARERPAEAGRWRAAAVAFPLVVVLLLFGGTTGGEGVRVLSALAGAAVVAANLAPRAAAGVRPSREAEPPVSHAA